MNILSLLSANSFLVVNKSLARKVGLDSAALFADLAGSQIYWETNNKLINGYFYRTQQDIEEQTTLSAKTQLRCLRILEDNKLVKTKLIGLPATKHYSIDQSCLDHLLKLLSTKVESTLSQSAKLVNPKVTTIENINIKNKSTENKNIEIPIKEAENKFSTESEIELSDSEEKETHSEKDCGFVYEEVEEEIETEQLDPMPKLLEEICIENDFDAIPMFPIMPKADWIMTKIKAFGRSGFVAVLQEIEGYAQRTPNYIGGKVQCLAKVFNQFAKSKEDKFESECKKIISDKYKELTGEGLESAKSDAKHLKDLIGKMRKSITEITGKEATESEILAGLAHIMKKLPAEFCSVSKFKIPLIAHNYQQIKLQIKNGTATNNTNGKKSVTGNAELDARLANSYGQGIGNIDPLYGF